MAKNKFLGIDWLGWTSIIIVLVLGISYLYTKTEYAEMNGLRGSSNYFYYQKFINKHPNGNPLYLQECRDSICEIARRKNNSLESLENILEVKNMIKDPKLLDDLEQIINDKIESLYQIAVETSTIAGWDNFIASVPEGYSRDAEAQKEEISKRQWKTEKTAWETASAMDNWEGYNKYISLYPYGRHSKVANKRIIDIEVDNVFAGEHGKLPKMDRYDYGYQGDYSNISLENQTEYKLTILYSGKKSIRITIPPHGNKQTTLPNGHYRISARVDALYVSPFAGEETLKGGRYSASYYISTYRY